MFKETVGVIRPYADVPAFVHIARYRQEFSQFLLSDRGFNGDVQFFITHELSEICIHHRGERDTHLLREACRFVLERFFRFNKKGGVHIPKYIYWYILVNIP